MYIYTCIYCCARVRPRPRSA